MPKEKICNAVADFETTTNPNDLRVWAWCVFAIEDQRLLSRGIDIESFIDYMSKQSLNIYFHNAKFDTSYLLYHALKNSIYKLTKTRMIMPGEFSFLMSDLGRFYQMEICHAKGVRTKIWDSLNKLPFSVEVIGKKFLGGETLKGTIDYDKPREPGYEPSMQEWHYIYDDCRIVAKALNVLFENKMTRMTIGGDCMLKYKESIFGQFEKFFPQLSKETDNYCRNAYFGGAVWCNPKYAGKITSGCVFDVNSLYPYVMYDFNLPFGEPAYYDGGYVKNDHYPLYIQKVCCMYKLKENHVPSLQRKTRTFNNNVSYITEKTDVHDTLYLTNYDMQLLKAHYDIIDIYPVDGYMFKAQKGLMESYIKENNEKKESAEDETHRQLYKLLNNNLYGKFGTNPKSVCKYPEYDAETDKVRFYNEEEKDRKSVYVPMAVFITAIARWLTITAAQKEFDRCIYFDTDSLHLEGYNFPDIKIDPRKLGYWKHEYNFSQGKYLHTKCYIDIEENGKKHIHIAGLPHKLFNDKGEQIDAEDYITMENFKPGFTAVKLKSHMQSGGILLKKSPFSVK